MDASLSSTPSVEMCRIEASPRMVTAWVAGVRVITPLAMPSSLSLFPGEANSKINDATSLPRGGGVRRWHRQSMVRDSSSTASVRQFAPKPVGDQGSASPCLEKRMLHQSSGGVSSPFPFDFRLSTPSYDTLCRWEFCGGFRAGWENRTT